MSQAGRYILLAINCLVFLLLVGPTLCYRQPLASCTPSVGQIDVSLFGIWDRSNAVNLSHFPYVRGKGVGIRWADLEPQRGKFTFDAIHKGLIEAGEHNRGFYCMVHAGPDSPQWIYEEDPKVPKVIMVTDLKPGKHENFHSSGFPYYLSPAYQKHFFDMILALAVFIRSHRYAANVKFVQANYGCTGDAELYKGTPSPEFAISDEHEIRFMKATWLKYKEAFQTGPGPIIPLLVNGGQGRRSRGPDWEKFAMENISPMGIKGSAWVRGHHLNGERSWIQRHRNYMLNPKDGSSTPFFFTRSEMDQTWKKPLYQLNLQLGFYWGVLNGLNQGLSYFDVSKDAMNSAEELGFLDSLLFFNKYAGQIWAHNSTGAFIALHLGLDAADEDKYPTHQYGRTHEDRLEHLCEEYKIFGCQLNDVEAATHDQVYQRDKQKGYNDAGLDIWPFNYARWLEQIDADETSQGLFRIGGELNMNSSKYARFARGFRHKANKTAMYFKFHDDFFTGRAVGSLSFRIVWYDTTNGSWQLEYMCRKGVRKVALDQRALGERTWKEAFVLVLDAVMDHSNARGSDFVLSSRDSTDVVFHMIEVSRLDGDETDTNIEVQTMKVA